MQELLTIIKEKIREQGPISFKEYMESALYHPYLGYYMTAQNKIGVSGDYFTSCCLGPVFGAMIGKQIAEMWELSGETNFTIVEFGAGNGTLCHDILDYFNDHTSLYDRLSYIIIEKSEYMRKREQSHLTEKVNWYDNLEDVGCFVGCVFSNELLDNFAVHRVVMQEELMEMFIDDQNGLTEVLRPACQELRNYFTELNVKLPNGYCTEVNLEAREWLKDISRYLDKGFVMTIDYGYLSDELYKPYRSEGTLICYQRHKVNEKLYEDTGCKDITAHVNFSALCYWGDQVGLSCCGMTSQPMFLLALDFKSYLRQHTLIGGDVLAQAIQESRLTRTLLVDMGNKFKVLIQHKAIDVKELTGLKVEIATNLGFN